MNTCDKTKCVQIALKLDAQKNGQLRYEELLLLSPEKIQALHRSVSEYLSLIEKAIN